LAEPAYSLFKPIPECVPEEMVWKYNNPEYPLYVELKKDHITIQIETQQRIFDWNDILGAGWAVNDSGALALALVFKGGKPIILPIDYTDKDCVKLIMACLRKLRTVKQPQWLEIPDQLFTTLDNEYN
jgi:hypothetical protein